MRPTQPQSGKLRTGKAHPLANTTPFPNDLFELMPLLKDSEWRVLCLVVRGTWGWKDGAGRKRSDWLTQRQMMQRTGRSSEALSRAVDALVRRGLIEVRDEDGELLTTPNERRRCGGRLYFSVKHEADDREDVYDKRTERKSEEVSVETHSTGYKSKGKGRKTASRTGKSEVPGRKSEEVADKSGVRKANTTKETETKHKDKKKNHEISESFRQEKPASSFDASNFSASEISSSFHVSEAEVNRFLHFYRELRVEYGNGHIPASNSERDDPVIARDLLRRHGFERLMDLLLRFLKERKDETRRDEECSLHAFKADIKRLLVEETKEHLLRPRVESGWSRAASRETRRPPFHPPDPPQP